MKKITILLKATFLILFLFSSTNFYGQIVFDGDNCNINRNGPEYFPTGSNHAFDDNDVGSVTATADIKNFWLNHDGANRKDHSKDTKECGYTRSTN